MTIQFPDHPITADMARSLGISRSALTEGVRRRQLLRPCRNLYVRSDIELGLETRARAMALVTSRHSVVCDRSAAWIWGVDCFAYRELDTPPPLESFTMRGHRASKRPEIRGGQRDLRDDDWIEVVGVRVTSPLRTALDLGCRLPRRDALATMDALMRAHGLTLAVLVASLPRFRGRRGVVQLREILGLADPEAESPGESWTRLEILDHGLPDPEVQWWVIVNGVPTYRLDLAYPHARIAIEYDGEEFHTSPKDRAADEERRNWLRAHGWTVIVVTKESFTDAALAKWIGELREALALAQRPPRRWFPRG